MSDVPLKQEIARELRDSGQELVRQLRLLPERHFDAGRYENGWNARQILAHVAAIEWTYPRLLDIPRSAPPAGGAGEPPTHQAQGGIDAYNARQVERRAGTPIADLIDEFERNRAATIAAVESADEDLLAQPIRSAGGRTGPLARVMHEVAIEHVRGHLRDILG
jgi:uncharacterized damage-inducible protein DinB